MLAPPLLLRNLKNPVSFLAIGIEGEPALAGREAVVGGVDIADDLAQPTSALRPEASRFNASSSISVLESASARLDCVTVRVV